VVLDRAKAEYVSFYKAGEVPSELRRMLEGCALVRSSRTEGAWLRIGWSDDETRRAMCGLRRDDPSPSSPRNPLEGIDSYEGDVDPVRRLLTDTTMEIAPPKRVFLDIETDSRKNFVQAKNGEARVLCWSLIDADGKRRCDVLEEDTDDAERELLLALWRELDNFDQVVAWNGDGFDFAVLWGKQERGNAKGGRTEKVGIRIEPRRWLWLDQLPLFKRMHSASSGDEKASMRLEDIGQAIVGEGKIQEGGLIPGKSLGAQTWEMWEAGGEHRARMVRYCVADTDLLRKIEAKTGYIALFDALCKVSRVFGNTSGLNPTMQMDGFLLRLGRERGFRFLTKHFSETTEKYKGAHVWTPDAPGITRDVHVADFSSFYPAVIVTWNMSPETKRAIAVNGPIPDGHTRAPTTGMGFTTEVDGILAVALREMLRLRKYWSDKQASLTPGTPEWEEAGCISKAYKVAANAFYGVVGSPFSRYFDKGIAESVTQTAVWLIKLTAAEAEKRGMKVIYGDTDSIFVTGCSREEFERFIAWCNDELYPRVIAAQGCRERLIKIAYEKQFDRIVFTSAKRYCGRYAHYKGKAATDDSKPEIKGVEYMRGDTGKLARQLQGEVIDMLVGGLKLAKGPILTEKLEDYHAALSNARDHVLLDPLPFDEVKLAKSLSRSIKEYVPKMKKDGTDFSQPSHVVVAKILKARGQNVDVGTKIEYVVTDGAGSPLCVAPGEDYTGECDRYYLWESIVYPPTQRLLESAFPGHDWASWGKVRPAKERKTSPKSVVSSAQLSLLAVASRKSSPAA
jgi:DNA polymerase I